MDHDLFGPVMAILFQLSQPPLSWVSDPVLPMKYKRKPVGGGGGSLWENVSIPDRHGLPAVTTEHLASMREGQDNCIVGALTSVNNWAPATASIWNSCKVRDIFLTSLSS